MLLPHPDLLMLLPADGVQAPCRLWGASPRLWGLLGSLPGFSFWIGLCERGLPVGRGGGGVAGAELVSSLCELQL